MLIFVFVDCWCFFVLVAVFLCCYVVKLGKANKKQKPKKRTPKNVEVLPGIFYKTSYGCMCQSYCFFLAVFLFFCLLLKKHDKKGFFDDFEMLIFSFFGQKSRVNNLAMVESIAWPFFCQNFAQKDGQVIDSTFFSHFFC